jgi:hypothetical protein
LCTAVGQLAPNNGPPTMLAERGKGTTWSPQRIAVASKTPGQLDGVSCPEPTVCIAVGAMTVTGVQTAAVARWHG